MRFSNATLRRRMTISPSTGTLARVKINPTTALARESPLP
jgi:hypothetical protein